MESFYGTYFFPKVVSTEGFHHLCRREGFIKFWGRAKAPGNHGKRRSKEHDIIWVWQILPSISDHQDYFIGIFWPSYLRVNLQNHWGQRRDVEKDIRQRGVFFFHPAPFRRQFYGIFPFWLEVYHSGWWNRMIFSKLVELQMDILHLESVLKIEPSWTCLSHNSIRRLPGPTCPTPPVPNTPVDLPWTRLASATQWKMISVWHGLHRENP